MTFKNLGYRIVFLALMAIPAQVHAQTYYYRQYNKEEGLSQSQALCLYQDDLGQIYIGTNGGGLNIFNGKEFKKYTEDEGMANNIVFDIDGNGKDKIWLATYGGVSHWDGRKMTSEIPSDSLPSEHVYSVCPDADKLWIGTDAGLCYYQEGKVHKITGHPVLGKKMVFDIFRDSKGRMWFGTTKDGVFMYDGQEYRQFQPGPGYQSYITYLNEDSHGNILINTAQGVFWWDGSEMHRLFPKDTFWGSYVDKEGKICFCSTSGDLIETYIGENNTVAQSHFINARDFEQYRFRDLLQDREGNTWLATYGDGVIMLPPRVFSNINMADGLHNNNIYAIAQKDENEYWIGPNKGGADQFIFQEKNYPKVEQHLLSYQVLNTIIGSTINSLASDGKNIYIGTQNGLSVYDGTTFHNYTLPDGIMDANRNDPHTRVDSSLPNQNILTLYMDSRNRLWIGTDKGPCIYQDGDIKDLLGKYPELKGKYIYNFCEDKHGNIWTGTFQSGIFVVSGDKVGAFGEEYKMSGHRIRNIISDEDGQLFFGTDHGIYRWNGKQMLHIDKNKGLSSNNIYLMIFDDRGNLFAGTDEGLNKITFREDSALSVKVFGAREGFVGVECNLNACYKAHDGKLWFGTVDGVNVYDPAFDKTNMVEPIPQIANIRLFFENFEWGEFMEGGLDSQTGLPNKLVFPYDQNHLSFDFVAASLTAPTKVKYRYKLEGLDEDWSAPSTENTAVYSYIPEGEYYFKVIACNNDGVWSEEPAVIGPIIIKPPFWRTLWFYSIVVVVIVIGIYAFIKWREAKLKRDKAILEETVRQRTAEVVKQKEIVEHQKEEIEDSIQYASKIQRAILPQDYYISENLTEYMILYRPKDVVSGDYYWFSEKDGHVIFTAADCTGHGVPGAFMSMLGMTFLNQVVNEMGETDPGKILDFLRESVIHALKQTGAEGENKDGMDMALFSFKKGDHKIKYAGANNPLALIREGEIIEYKADKMPIAIYEKMDPFTTHEVEIQKGDCIYGFSDGYPDQFGGPKGKKFMSKKFKKMLAEIAPKPMKEQEEILNQRILDWMEEGGTEQIDDVTVVGVRFN